MDVICELDANFSGGTAWLRSYSSPHPSGVELPTWLRNWFGPVFTGLPVILIAGIVGQYQSVVWTPRSFTFVVLGGIVVGLGQLFSLWLPVDQRSFGLVVGSIGIWIISCFGPWTIQAYLFDIRWWLFFWLFVLMLLTFRFPQIRWSRSILETILWGIPVFLYLFTPTNTANILQMLSAILGLSMGIILLISALLRIQNFIFLRYLGRQINRDRYYGGGFVVFGTVPFFDYGLLETLPWIVLAWFVGIVLLASLFAWVYFFIQEAPNQVAESTVENLFPERALKSFERKSGLEQAVEGYIEEGNASQLIVKLSKLGQEVRLEEASIAQAIEPIIEEKSEHHSGNYGALSFDFIEQKFNSEDKRRKRLDKTLDRFKNKLNNP